MLPNLSVGITRIIALLAVVSGTVTQFLPQLTDDPKTRAAIAFGLAVMVVVNNEIAHGSNPDGTPVNSTSEKTVIKTTVEKTTDKPEEPKAAA